VRDKAEILKHELDQLQKQIATLEATLEDKPEYGLGKGAPAVTRWELDRALLQQLKKRATKLERTLSQIDDDTYGICRRCGNPIHPDRLTVLPDARTCINCATEVEVSSQATETT
jgi:RNA polymerase-binding transcription factor DksA